MSNDVKKFITMSFEFIIIFIIIFLSLNFIYNYYILSKKNIYKNKDMFMESFDDTLTTLILGDSRSATAVNSELLQNSFNYSIPGETYEQTYYKARKILASDNNISTIILPLDMQSFSDYRSNPYVDVWYWKNYMSPEELESVTGKSKYTLLLNSYFPFLGNGVDFRVLIRHDQESGTQKGLRRLPVSSFASSTSKKIECKKRIDIQFKHYPDVKSKILLNSFKKIVDLGMSKNKKIVFIKYPVTDCYIKAVIDKGIDIDDFYNEINDYIKNKDNVFLLDYQDDYSDIYFHNMDHFNEKGSIIFTEKLEKDLEKLPTTKEKIF